MNKIVLNAEDNLDDMLLLKRACGKARTSFGLHFVEDGEAAIQYLLGQGEYADRKIHPLPDLILLDLKMPRKDGLEFLRWFKQQPTFSSTAVIVFTSSTDEEDIRSAVSSGASCYLAKPLRYQALVALVSTIDAALNANRDVSAELAKLGGCYSVGPAE